MRPAGATLRLFAQWLHPTTICRLRTAKDDFLAVLFMKIKYLTNKED